MTGFKPIPPLFSNVRRFDIAMKKEILEALKARFQGVRRGVRGARLKAPLPLY